MIILVIEDNKEQSDIIKTILEQERYVVDVAADGREAMHRLEVRDYDLILLDLDLPVVSGQEILDRAREMKIATPILILTAHDEMQMIVELLDRGADDYIVKPFSIAELMARVRALFRRPQQFTPNTFISGRFEIKYGTHEATINGTPIKLTKNEFRLLDFLVRKADRVCTRSMIQEHVWGYDTEHKSNLIEVVIYSLRRKLRKLNADLIETVQNIGYRIKSEDMKNI